MPRQIEKNSRELPIPIDSFKITAIPGVVESSIKRFVAPLDYVSLWATINPVITYKQLELLLSQNALEAIRINSAKFSRASDMIELVDQFYNCRSRLCKKVALCLDTAGPKIRVTNMKEITGQEYLDVSKGDTVCVVAYEKYKAKIARGFCFTDKVLLIDTFLPLTEIDVQGYIFVSDGWQQLKIDKVTDDLLYCTALHDALIYDKRGVTIAGMYDRLNPLTARDRKMLDNFSRVYDSVDYIGLSFTNYRQDIEHLLEYLMSINLSGKIVAKIETNIGVDNIFEIAQVSDAVMVARGDLAVELAPYERNIIAVEDNIRAVCGNMRKKCIVATRVADSLEEGRNSLDKHELFRLYHELQQDWPLVLMLANETTNSQNAERNYNIILSTILQLQAVISGGC